jgi:hypothetical protein
MLALTSPTSGGRSVGVDRSWTKATEFIMRKTVQYIYTHFFKNMENSGLDYVRFKFDATKYCVCISCLGNIVMLYWEITGKWQCSDMDSGGTWFEMWPGHYHLSWMRVWWFYSISPGKWRYSISKHAKACSFHMLQSSPFTAILLYDHT